MEPGAPDERIVLSTDEFAGRDRDALVRDFYGRICMRLDLEPLDENGLRLEATTAVMPGLSVSRGMVAPMSWERNASLMADANDDVIVSWMATGYRFDQDGFGTIETVAGAPCIMPLDRSWRASAPQGGWTVCVQATRSLLEPLIRDLGDLPPDAIRRDTPEGRLLVDYVAAATRTPMRPAMAAVVSRHIADLMALAMGATRDAAHIVAGRGVRAARLRQVKQFVEENLSNPRLSAETAGRNLDLSPRYIRRLFADEGQGFSDYVAERRLARIRRQLADPRYASRSIADLAFDAGLVEPSTFYRQFRARYAMTPSEARIDLTEGA